MLDSLTASLEPADAPHSDPDVRVGDASKIR
jgi:hypothetical protein